jgi:hypothetical protein
MVEVDFFLFSRDDCVMIVTDIPGYIILLMITSWSSCCE